MQFKNSLKKDVHDPFWDSKNTYKLREKFYGTDKQK